jgi:hypothetical protein
VEGEYCSHAGLVTCAPAATGTAPASSIAANPVAKAFFIELAVFRIVTSVSSG